MTYFLLTLTAFFWGLNFHLAQLVLKVFPPFTYATIRFSFAAGCLAILYYFSNKTDIKYFYKKWWAYLILGFIGIYGYNVFFIEAIQSTSATNAALIQSFNPIMTGILAYFINKQTLTKTQVFAMLLSLMGVFIILTKGDFQILKTFQFAKGDLLMVIVSFTFAMFNVLNARWLSNSPYIMTSTFTTVFSSFLFIITAIPEFPTVKWLEISAFSWFIMFIMSFGGSVLSSIWWVQGVNKIGAAPASIFMNLVPVFVAFIAFFLNQSITGSQIIGGLLVILGVFLSTISKMIKKQMNKNNVISNSENAETVEVIEKI